MHAICLVALKKKYQGIEHFINTIITEIIDQSDKTFMEMVSNHI